MEMTKTNIQQYYKGLKEERLRVREKLKMKYLKNRERWVAGGETVVIVTEDDRKMASVVRKGEDLLKVMVLAIKVRS